VAKANDDLFVHHTEEGWKSWGHTIPLLVGPSP
jgi:hypothetical protein